MMMRFSYGRISGESYKVRALLGSLSFKSLWKGTSKLNDPESFGYIEENLLVDAKLAGGPRYEP